jgi:hypothetical protein
MQFQNLGKPIQDLLFLLNSEVSDDDLNLLSKITVRQLAKVFDMMSSGEDPEKILAWLRRTAKRNVDGDDPYQNERKKKVVTGASRDPINFYKEIERRNLELQERHKKAAEIREQERKANIVRREEERKKQAAKAAEEKARAEANGENTTALDRLKKKDRAELANTFERFAAKQSTFDNSMKAQDGEWWKKEEFRRDFEKMGKKGTKWKSVVEGANEAAPQAELAVREEWFKSQGWWKSDKYRNDWNKSRDVEWWKETAYIKDWQDRGAKGSMWTAADELSGFNGKGHAHTAPTAELNRRVEWYKVNGPKGVAKLWNALAEGVPDRCTLEEKREREDFYKNGDWWRNEDQFRKFNAAGADPASMLKFSGPAGEDREWWKDEMYRKDFEKGGDLWRCANEQASLSGKAKETPSTQGEAERREEWFKTNWWKAQAYQDDYKVNGEKGELWRCRAEEDAKSGKPKPCKDSEALQREMWFQSAPDREWWKDEIFRQDYEQNGEKGEKWTAACADIGAAGRAADMPAADAEKRKREDWYKQNWWKADRFKKDYLENPNATAWQVKDAKVNEDKDWWKQANYRDDWKKNDDAAAAAPGEFWKSSDAVEDYQKNGDKGTKWKAEDGLTASVNKAQSKPASDAEIAKRKQWLDENWWRAPKYQADHAANGMKGTLWTAADAASAGKKPMTNAASPAELAKRQEAFKQKGPAWRALTETDAVAREGNKSACSPVEALDRAKWHKQNWWKGPEARADYEKNGPAGELWKAGSEEAAKLGKATDPEYQCSPEEVKAREKWYETAADMEFWKDPAYVEDFEKKGKDGALWQARNAVDARRALGKDQPVQKPELKEREDWYKKNHWKSPEAIKEYFEKGKGGEKWQQAAAGAPEKANDAELKKRENWLKAHAPASADELKERADYLKNQLNDTEIKHRNKWLDNRGKEDKRINRDELNDLLTMLNQGVAPTKEQVKAVEEKVAEGRRKNPELDSDPASISQEEFVHAVAEAGFYVPPTEREKKLTEEEALEELEKEEIGRVEEEAAFLAMEAEEERKNSGNDGSAGPTTTAEDDEEARFLREQEAQKEAKPNEDDVITEDQESAWQEFQKAPGISLKTPEQEAAEAEQERLAAEEEARKAAEQKAWNEEAQADDAPEEEHQQENNLKEEDKEDLQAEVEEDENKEWAEEEATEAAEPAKDEMTAEEKGTPQAWKLPLPQVTNPQFLKAYFTVLKFVPKHTLIGGKQKRVWVVDHFTKSFYNMDTSGKIKKEHAANKLLQLEKNVTDPKRVRLMFFDASHSYELSFQSCEERERFFESSSAIRPSIRVYSPELTKPDSKVEVCSTTVDGVGANTVIVKVPNPKGEIIDRELTGECKINASRVMTEPLTVWVGTFNLCGAPPPKNPEELQAWCPKNKYDIYAIAIQEGSYQKEENEWFQYIQGYIGKDYLTLANMNLWDTYLIVLTKKKNLLKITNVEGSTKATQHKNVCGTKGGVGISLRFHETSMCFVACQLAARQERTAMRNTNLEEIIDCLQLSNKDTDFTQQFHHVFFFGDFNYRVEMEDAEALPLIKAGTFGPLLDQCQFNQQRRDEGILNGFEEAPITFKPTYRYNKGTAEYSAEKGRAPAYTDRVLVRSMTNTWVRCLSYDSTEKITISEHMPVSASYIMRAIRPTMSCFSKIQEPKVRLTFPEIKIIENKGPVLKKPLLMLCTCISESPHNCKTLKEASSLPVWAGEDVPVIDCTNHLPEYLEAQQVVIILRDSSEKRDDKALRGTAIFCLKEYISGKQDVEQETTLDLIVHGKKMGQVSLKFKWVPRV